MASDPLDEMERAFPLEQTFVDHSGQPRSFQINLYKHRAGGFRVEALRSHESTVTALKFIRLSIRLRFSR